MQRWLILICVFMQRWLILVCWFCRKVHELTMQISVDMAISGVLEKVLLLSFQFHNGSTKEARYRISK